MDSKDSGEKRPLSFASNSSEGSQFIILRKTEKSQFGESLSENSEGNAQEDYSVQNSISKFPSEPYISNNVEQLKPRSSSLCNFYQYYYDQFLTAKSNKFGKNKEFNEKSQNDTSHFDTSIRKVIKELVETESLYVKDLQEIIEGYMNPMKKNLKLNFHDCDEIFSNISLIYSFNKSLLKELEESGYDFVLVCKIFIKNHQNFFLYSAYCSNYPKCLEILERYMSKSHSHIFLTSLQKSLSHKLPLATYLLKPIQRISKYHLFFQNIINCFPTQHQAATKPQIHSSLALQPINQFRKLTPSPHRNEKVGALTSPQKLSLGLPASLSSKSLPSTPHSSSFDVNSNKEIVNEALKCMNGVMERLNQSNTLKKHDIAYRSKNKTKNNVKERKTDFKNASSIGNLLFKEKLLSGSQEFYLFVFFNAVMLTRKKNKNKHMVKVFYEVKDVILVEDIPKEPTCFALLSLQNPSLHTKLKANSLEHKVRCCHQVKRVATHHACEFPQVVKSFFADSSKSKNEAKEKIIDKSSFISIEGSPSYQKVYKEVEKPAVIHHSTQHNNKQRPNKNYLFTLKVPKTRKSKGFWSSYKEVKCNDACVERCDGVYKKHQSSPPLDAYMPPFAQNISDYSSTDSSYSPVVESPDITTSDSFIVSIDFYEENLSGILDNVSISQSSSDFGDFNDSVNSPHLNDDAFLQCAF